MRLGPLILLTLDGDKLPTEFRIFRPGWNETRNGRYLFDEVAAAAVIGAFEEHGARGQIDLEHLSVAAEQVTGDARNYDPDARGWYDLELRNGELWAVNVTWTPDGERRLREKTQIYVSPAFPPPGDDGRPMSITNIALTGLPATDDPQPLMAASLQGSPMTPIAFLKAYRKLTASQLSLPPGKLLDVLAIDMKTLQAVVKAMGGDPAGDLTSLFQAVAGFAKELAASASGEPAPSEPESSDDPGVMMINPEEQPEATSIAATRQTTTQIRALTKAQAEQAETLALANQELNKLRKIEADRVEADRVELCRQAVKADVLKPGQVWANGKVGEPQGWLNALSLDDIRGIIKNGGGSLAPSLLSTTPRPPSEGGAATHVPQFPAAPGIEVHQKEADRVQYAIDQQNELLRRKSKPEIVLSAAMDRYVEVKAMQLRGAKNANERAERGGKLGDRDRPLICGISGTMSHARLELLTAQPVNPAEPFGFSSREAMREFNTAYMVAVAAMPRDWIGEVGDVQPSGALETTYPLDFSDPKWRKFVAQAAMGETPQSADIEVVKEPYGVAKDADWNRLQRDFAYMNTWLAGGAQFARGRLNLRSYLVVNLLVSNPLWAVSRKKPSGLTGKNFFATDHPINPFNDEVKGPNGLSTYSNYSVSGSPLDSPNLSAEKDQMMLVPYLDGIPFGETVSHILHPTILTRTAMDLLTVQDLILAGELVADSGAGVGTMGQIRNPHFNSGLQTIQAPHLPGATPATADYYLFSEGIAAQGYAPWVVAEDLVERVIDHDIDSHHGKTTDWIRTERRMNVSAVLVWQHAIRKVLAVAP